VSRYAPVSLTKAGCWQALDRDHCRDLTSPDRDVTLLGLSPEAGAEARTQRAICLRKRVLLNEAHRKLKVVKMPMFKERRHSDRVLEVSLFAICAALTFLLYSVVGYKMVVLNLFYLPVVLAAFYLGRHRAGVLALVCVLLASVVAVLDLEGFAATTTPLVIGLSLVVWSAVMGLNAIFVGTLGDERSKKIDELHDAYLGVVEVLAHYLKSASPEKKDHSKRVALLSQAVARRMRLSEREVDDIRVAALLQDINNLEVTAKVIQRAVGDLSKSATHSSYTFHGSDLVQSLGSVLTSAMPLIVNQSDGLDISFGDEEPSHLVDAPFGTAIIHTVSHFDMLTHDSQDIGLQEAINIMRSELDADHHPAVLHALEQEVHELTSRDGDAIADLERLTCAAN